MSEPICDAGRKAFFSGRWQTPCPHEGRHALGWPGVEEYLRFCDGHMQALIDAGLIQKSYLTMEELDRLTGAPDDR